MITVQFSKGKELVLPESLGHALGLREGDRVQVQRQDSVLWFRRRDTVQPPGPLTDLCRIVSSSLPVNSVDVDAYMDKHGCEQVYGRLGL
jgi:antitoxin component of MazEF toxin-antitoxin module